MYLYTSQELQLMHEERVGHLTKNQAQPRKERKASNTMKQLIKLFKREEA